MIMNNSYNVAALILSPGWIHSIRSGLHGATVQANAP